MFMQVVKARVKDEAGTRKAIDQWQSDLKPGAIGYLGSTAGFVEDGTFLVVARFESADAAQRNGDRPEQGAWFAEMSSNFDGEPEFINVDDVQTFLDGGSDDAGFVQVMIGQSPDRAKLVESMGQDEEGLREGRPDLIGGLLGGFGDNGFVNVGYFTSESAAREGESKEPPAEMKDRVDEFQRLMGDVSFYDLKDPILYSK